MFGQEEGQAADGGQFAIDVALLAPAGQVNQAFRGRIPAEQAFLFGLFNHSQAERVAAVLFKRAG